MNVAIKGLLASGLILCSHAASAETIPTTLFPLMQACVQSGGQTGFRGPTSSGGIQSVPLFSPSMIDMKQITVNVWSDQPLGGQIFMQINFVQNDGKQVTQPVTTNSSLTVNAKLASLFVAGGNNTLAWCTHIAP